MARVLKTLTALVVLGTVLYFWHPPRLIVLKLAGRASGCPLVETVGSFGNAVSIGEAREAIGKKSRLIEKQASYQLWETPRGRFWAPSDGGNGLLWALAEQEMDIYGSGARSVQAGDVVLDCGANVGVFTHVALAAGARKVVAIEPAPESLECLRRNFGQQIEAGRVLVYPKGVWDREEALAINRAGGNSAADSFVFKGTGKGPVLPLTTIDKLVTELRLERVDFIKMDIEGAEEKALAGARQTIAKFHPRMALAAYHRLGDTDKLPAAARRFWPGYRLERGACLDAGSYVRPITLFLY